MHDLELIMRGLNELGNANAVLEPSDYGPRISFKATSKSNFFLGFYKKSRIPLEMMNSRRFCCKLKNLPKIRHFQQLLYAKMFGSALWQYGLWSFQMGGIKLERYLPKNQHTQRKLLNFENWINGGLRSFQKSDFKKSIIFLLPFS